MHVLLLAPDRPRVFDYASDARAPVATKDAIMPESGGVLWELGEARKLYVAALLAADDGALEVASHRLVDALVNASSSGAALQLVPMMLALREARTDAQQAHSARRTDAIVSEHNQSMLIDQAEIVQAEQGQQAARLGLAEAAILGLLLALAVSKADRTAMSAELIELKARLARLEASDKP